MSLKDRQGFQWIQHDGKNDEHYKRTEDDKFHNFAYKLAGHIFNTS